MGAYVKENSKESIRIGSRKSPLALAQTRLFMERFAVTYPQVEITLVPVESTGDLDLQSPLWKFENKGAFTSDLTRMLEAGEIDVVVHSWKDLPVEDRAKTAVVGTFARADARDVLLLKKKNVADKNEAAKSTLDLLSSSPRRAHNLGQALPALLPVELVRDKKIKFHTVRGNIQTRLLKSLDTGVDGIIVAKAALDRLQLDLSAWNWMILPLSENPTAAAQGALAFEVRRDDKKVVEWVQGISDSRTLAEVGREREILQEFGGGCHLALGISVLSREKFQMEFVRGLSPLGQEIQSHRCTWFQSGPPSGLRKWASMDALHAERKPLKFAIPNSTDTLLISREVDPEILRSHRGVLLTSGVKTWKKLAAENLWIHGSLDSLGNGHLPDLKAFGAPSEPKVLSYFGDSRSYELELKINEDFARTKLEGRTFEKDFIYWKSVSQFRLLTGKYPQLTEAFHACGMGSTYEYLSAHLPAHRIWPFFSQEDWKNY